MRYLPHHDTFSAIVAYLVLTRACPFLLVGISGGLLSQRARTFVSCYPVPVIPEYESIYMLYYTSTTSTYIRTVRQARLARSPGLCEDNTEDSHHAPRPFLPQRLWLRLRIHRLHSSERCISVIQVAISYVQQPQPRCLTLEAGGSIRRTVRTTGGIHFTMQNRGRGTVKGR